MAGSGGGQLRCGAQAASLLAAAASRPSALRCSANLPAAACAGDSPGTPSARTLPALAQPLSVQAPGAAGGAAGWSGRKKAAVALGLALLFGALVALVLHYRGHPALTTGRFHGASECAARTPPVVCRGGK